MPSTQPGDSSALCSSGREVGWCFLPPQLKPHTSCVTTRAAQVPPCPHRHTHTPSCEQSPPARSPPRCPYRTPLTETSPPHIYTEQYAQQSGLWPRKGLDGTHREEVKRDPLTPPNVDRATEIGMIQAMTPRSFSPKVWERKQGGEHKRRGHSLPPACHCWECSHPNPPLLKSLRGGTTASLPQPLLHPYFPW